LNNPHIPKEKIQYAITKEFSAMNVMEMIEREQMRGDIPDFRTGDTIKVFVRIVEGQKQRIQAFEGVVIRRRNGDVRANFTVRKISYGVGVERTFPLHSPAIDRIEVVTRGKVRRSRLYYLRNLRGKQARIKEAGK
jgi:large subunit ribosomal protein L19